MNNPKIVSPEKTGKNPFLYADEMKQPKSRQMDNQFIEEQQRHASGYFWTIINTIIECICQGRELLSAKSRLTR